jgi:hypothetical protein
MVDHTLPAEKPVTRSDLFAALAMHAILSRIPRDELEDASFKEIADLAWCMDEWMRSEGPEDGA